MIFNRYIDTPTKKTGYKTHYETELLPDFKSSNDDIYIITKRGDRLDLLADQFYNDYRLWWIIATVNNLGQGSINVEPGTQLKIVQI